MKKLLTNLSNRRRSAEHTAIAAAKCKPIASCDDQHDDMTQRKSSYIMIPNQPPPQRTWIPSASEIEHLRLQILQDKPLLQIKELLISYKRGRNVAPESFLQGRLELVLLEASRRGKLDVVTYMLNKFRQCISINRLMKTPPFGLMSCEVAQKGNDFPGKNCTYTLLHVATGQLVTELLIRNGAVVDVPNCCGDTPLHIAVKRFAYENHSHSMRIRPSDKTTINAIKCLVSAGADVNAQNSNGETPLMFAVESVSVFQPIFQLLQHSVSRLALNTVDKRGLTALHRASASEISLTLLESGADPQFCSLSSSPTYTPCPLYLAAAEYTNHTVTHYLIHPLCKTNFKTDTKLLVGATKRLKMSYVVRYGLYNCVKDEWQAALKLASHCAPHTLTLSLLENIRDIVSKDEVGGIRGLEMAIRILEVLIGNNHPHMIFLYHKAHRLSPRPQLACDYLMKAAKLLLYQLQRHIRYKHRTRLAELREHLHTVFSSTMSFLDYCTQKGIAIKHNCCVDFLRTGIQILRQCDILDHSNFHCYWKLENSCARSLLWCFNRWLEEDPHNKECNQLGKQFVGEYSFLFQSSLLEISLTPHLC